MTLGEIIKEYREKNKLSMDDFAKSSGISKAYISILEKNKRPKTDKPVTPSITVIKQCADAMHISFDDLFNALDGDVTVNSRHTKFLEKEIENLSDREVRFITYYLKLHPEEQERLQQMVKLMLGE